MSDTRKLLPSALSARITEYLSQGGLWNPESMDHDNVRDLLMDCQSAFDAAPSPARVVPEFYEWQHGCDAVCNNVTLWLFKCPHCGKPRPEDQTKAGEQVADTERTEAAEAARTPASPAPSPAAQAPAAAPNILLQSIKVNTPAAQSAGETPRVDALVSAFDLHIALLPSEVSLTEAKREMCLIVGELSTLARTLERELAEWKNAALSAGEHCGRGQ